MCCCSLEAPTHDVASVNGQHVKSHETGERVGSKFIASAPRLQLQQAYLWN